MGGAAGHAEDAWEQEERSALVRGMREALDHLSVRRKALVLEMEANDREVTRIHDRLADLGAWNPQPGWREPTWERLARIRKTLRGNPFTAPELLLNYEDLAWYADHS